MKAPIDSSASSRRARDEQLGAHAQLARPREQPAAREGSDARRDAEHRCGGQRVQPSAALDVREARRLGRDQAIAEADLLAERDAFGLLNQQRVGAAVDGVAVDLFADDHAAGAGRALEHDEGGAVPRELVGGREAGDASADDDASKDASEHARSRPDRREQHDAKPALTSSGMRSLRSGATDASPS